MEGPYGLIVISKAGRDKGRRFVVVGIADEQHVLICDGKTHKAAGPKRKKLKHLQFTHDRIEGLAQGLALGGAADAFIRKALKPTGYGENTDNKEG